MPCVDAITNASMYQSSPDQPIVQTFCPKLLTCITFIIQIFCLPKELMVDELQIYQACLALQTPVEELCI
jgi:hypothetical protein